MFSFGKITNAETSLLSVAATDTIAGYSASIKAFDLKPKQEITFRVEKPEESVIEITEIADETGIAELNFLGFHTNKAGTYKVWAFSEKSNMRSTPDTEFEVYPDSVSSVYSRIQVLQDSAPSNGVDPIKIQIQLRDDNGNPIPNHFVELISSRKEDTIDAIGNGSTNAFGEILFHIRSEYDGVSHFSVLDRNSGIILEERGKAIFFQENTEQAQGGDKMYASLFDTQDVIFPGGDDEYPPSFGIVDHFLVKVDSPGGKQLQRDPWDMTVTAVDAEDNKVSTYTGTIIITASDSVKIPKDGKAIDFGIDEQGSISFTKAITFPQSGTYTVGVTEFDIEAGEYTNIKGETTVEVFNECQKNCEDEPALPGEPNIFVIDIPKNGNTYGTKTITVKGKNTKKNQIRVYLDDREIKTITPDADGLFFDDSGITGDTDGEHTLVFEDIELEKKSDPITFSIDATAPELISYTIDPSGNIIEGNMFTVTVFSERNLNSAKLTIKETKETQNFTEDASNPGKYTATMRAPETAGEYTLDVELKDSFEHLTLASNISKITIIAEEETLGAPENLTFILEDQGVILSWDAPQSGRENIDQYSILSGVTETSLEKFTEVSSETTTKKINGIIPGETRYFSVIAVDRERNESEQSNIISVKLEKLDEPPPDDEPEPVELGNTLQVIPRDGEVSLRWADPKSNTKFFDVRFGISSGVYTERFLMNGNIRSAIVPDLINDVPYYFTVVPLNANGSPTGELYEEKFAMPVYSGLHRSAEYQGMGNLEKMKKTDDTGPEALFVLFLSLSFSAAMFFFHRALRFSRL